MNRGFSGGTILSQLEGPEQEKYVPPYNPYDNRGMHATGDPHYGPSSSASGNITITTQPRGAHAYQDAKEEKKPFNCIIPACLVFLCCCWPLGIAALHYANLANIEWGEGNIDKARDSSNTAQKLIIAGVVCGIGIITTVVLIYKCSGLM